MCWKTISKATDFVGLTDTKADAQAAENAAYEQERAAASAMQNMQRAATPAADYSSSSTKADNAVSAADYEKTKAARIASLGNRNILTTGSGLTGNFSTAKAGSKKKVLG